MHALRATLDKFLLKDVKSNWSVDCQKGFDNLKTALASDLTLTHYVPNKEIYVASDASNLGLGAVLLHKEDGHTSCFEDFALHGYELFTNWKKKGFTRYLLLRNFTNIDFILLTDQRQLPFIFGSKKGIPAHSANRLQRWETIL